MKKLFCILTLLLALVCVWVACDEEAPHTHVFGEWSVTTASTCSAKGEEKRTCACGEIETREIDMLSHNYGEWVVTTAASCGTAGEEIRSCSCGSSETRELAPRHTSTKELKCGLCGAKVPYHLEGGYIYFGEYPQTLKASDVMITVTTDSRGYYLGSDNAYYAKVVANSFGNYTFSNGNAVIEGLAYYFKVEPILWRILSQSNDIALILCDSIIANRAFDSGKDFNNNYAESDIRAWLNAEFYNTAFTALEQELILITALDNSVASTGYDTNPYICESTDDKVFLLSCAEAKNKAYSMKLAVARRMQTSDYSRATGAYTSTNTGDYGNGYWWLRSPGNADSDSARLVQSDGLASFIATPVYSSPIGIVPAMRIRLN